jgi:hypothetical protein
LKPVIEIHAQSAFWQILEMTDRGLDDKTPAQIFAQRFGFRG